MTLTDELRAATLDVTEARREIARPGRAALEALGSADLHAALARRFARGLELLNREGLKNLQGVALTLTGRYYVDDPLAEELDDVDGAELVDVMDGDADDLAAELGQPEATPRVRTRGKRGGKRHRRRADDN